MIQATTFPDEVSLCIERTVQIAAPIGIAFDAMLEQLGPGMEGEHGESMRMTLEHKPGGRWFRDLGDDNGHLWGHVQVFKRPVVLEIIGPLFMSYPVIGHVQFRFTEKDGGTHLAFVHRAVGMIDPDHKVGVTEGWREMVEKIRVKAEVDQG